MSDDFDDDLDGADGFEDDAGFEDFDTGDNLAGAWRNNPVVKMGIIFGVIVALIGGIILFGGSGDAPPPASLSARGTEVAGTPGSGEISDNYRAAVEETNMRRVEDAIRGDTSAIPTPISGREDRLSLPNAGDNEEDPLARWRRIQEERQRQQRDLGDPEELPTEDPYAETIAALAAAMADQMTGILDGLDPQSPISEEVTNDSWLEEIREKEAEDAIKAEEAAAEAASENDDEEIENVIIPAGTIEYAQLLIEANSDVEGPILAVVVSGPLSGSRMLGEFEKKDEYLVMTFNSIVIDGVVHSTEAVAINPDTANVGMATEVDHRYFKRVILPAAAAFIEGMGEAIAESGSTTVTVGGVGGGDSAVSQEDEDLDTEQELAKATGKAFEKVSEFVDEDADGTEILVRVAAGTPMGILFVEPVVEEADGI